MTRNQQPDRSRHIDPARRACRLPSMIARLALGLLLLWPMRHAVSAKADSVHAAVKPFVVQVEITDVGFNPAIIIALQSERMQVRVTNHDTQSHQFSIPKLSIYTEKLRPGKTSFIAFTPQSIGRFEMTSDPHGADRPGFKGTLIVTAGT